MQFDLNLPLYPWQEKCIETLDDPNVQIVGVSLPRQNGKSHLLTAVGVAAVKRGLSVLSVSERLDKAKEVWNGGRECLVS